MKQTNAGGPGSKPMYWDILSDIDKLGYEELQKDIATTIAISGRAKFCKNFSVIFDKIRNYIVRHNESDKTRSLVCGIVWMNEVLALNTRQLITLIGKCKSSVNCAFQSIGYVTVPMETNAAIELAGKFPFLRDSIVLTRQWTLRRHTSTITNSVSQPPSEKIPPNAEISTFIPDVQYNTDDISCPFTDFVDDSSWISGDDLLYTAFF